MLLSFKKRYSVIDIWEPKYSTRTVLIATRKVAERNKIVIKHPKKVGVYDGEYFLSGVVASAYPIKSNGRILCYEVPLSQLELI